MTDELPKGWTQEQVDDLADFYDTQTDVEALAEDVVYFAGLPYDQQPTSNRD